MPVTVTYFDVYGKGECLRMTLHKAGVPFVDNRVSGDTWKELKASGKVEFGQLPMVTLEDGTNLFQTTAIVNYLGTVHKLRPEDPMLVYKGEKTCELMWNDFFAKQLVKVMFLPEGPDRVTAMANLTDVEFPNFMSNLAKCLSTEHKFICGDTTTIYDFQVAGFFCNLILNPNAKNAEAWTKVWQTAPDSVKKYVADFQEDMKDYLANRVQTCTI